MNCKNTKGCCSPCSALAQQLEETNTRAVAAYNLAETAMQRIDNLPIGGGGVQSVNGQLPDQDGDVTILRKTTATLAAASWTSNTQTVTVTGLEATEDVLVSPAPASWTDWGTAGIRAVSQAAGSLTFECDTEPTSDLTAQIIIGSIA